MESAAFGMLLDRSQDKVCLLEEDGTITYVNAVATPMLGFDPDELVGGDIFEFIHSEDVKRVREAFRSTIRTDDFAEATVEYRHRTADGGWVWLESRMSNLTDEALDGYVVSSRDITDRVTAERDRDETARRLEEIAAVSGDVLWMFSGDWSELLFLNPAYEEIYGASVGATREDPTAFLDAIHPDDIQAVEAAMRCLSRGEAVDMEYRVNPDEGYNRWVWVQGQPVVEDGEVVRITGFTRDITDRHRRERQLVVIDNLLRHNLRNDLNVVSGTAELIEEEFPEAADRTAVIRETSRDLLQSAEKEREIIDHISERPGREPVDLRRILADSVSTARERHPDAVIDVSGLDSASVRGRPELELGLLELMENAIQHSTADRPRVSVVARRTDTHIEVTVEDNAPPIPAVEADVLAGNHDMTEVYHSSGLGLWLVYWSVNLSNGHITVHSDESGNRITLSLPRA